ncbi:GRF1-interacting factor 2-like isoform X1 [Vigna radiata var. radiata]|uniref:GRF1-interacting factor 2-like isoform X1 n=1 Tax=Vigna radiata var. radiata TaxID=3916 RepID=A0A3Q0FGD8_VIGRR|nr:GRF1-interacting factor 2-like isoform X1 [Vigna radiata var. radiata]
MFNADPSLPNVSTLTTEQIQKYLEENKELILAILEYQNLGKFAELAQCQAKLQHNLTYLAKLADAGSQSPTPSQVSSHATMQQGQGMRQLQVAMSQPQPDLSKNLPFEIMSDQQQLQQQLQQQWQQQLQQPHVTMSLQEPDILASKLPLLMNEQNYKIPHFLYQQQPIPGAMVNFPGSNSGIYQASQIRLGNLPDTPSSNQTGSDSVPGWS